MHSFKKHFILLLLNRVDALETVPTKPDEDEDGAVVPDPPRLQLSAEKVVLHFVILNDVHFLFRFP